MTLPFTMPRWAWGALAALILILGIFVAVKSYGNSRYDAGVKDTDAKWEEASKKLVEKSLKAEGVADTKAEARAEKHAATVAAEKEKIDEAVSEGRSPFDVLFPAQRR